MNKCKSKLGNHTRKHETQNQYNKETRLRTRHRGPVRQHIEKLRDQGLEHDLIKGEHVYQ